MTKPVRTFCEAFYAGQLRGKAEPLTVHWVSRWGRWVVALSARSELREVFSALGLGMFIAMLLSR